MYLHIGQNILLEDKNIIGIFDLDNITVSKISREFLEEKEKQKKVNVILSPTSPELPKSLILTQSEDNEKIYISQLSTQILKMRADSNIFAKE